MLEKILEKATGHDITVKEIGSIVAQYGFSESNLYFTPRGERKTIKLAPYKLEYGIRDDKFQMCGISIYHGKPNGYVKVNLARILSITTLL